MHFPIGNHYFSTHATPKFSLCFEVISSVKISSAALTSNSHVLPKFNIA